jgi:hypothetical protein
MTLVNNFCCCNKKQKKPVKYPPGCLKKDGPPIQGEPYPEFACNGCNKMGLFTRLDYDFGIKTSSMKDLDLPCRCKSKRDKRPLLTQQGRSCQCLVRPALQVAKCGSGCVRPDGCGCNNKVPEEKYRLCACSVKDGVEPKKSKGLLYPTNYEA